MLALLSFGGAYAFVAPFSSRPVISQRAVAPAMGANKKTVTFEQDGVFEGREISLTRKPVKILTRINELEVATGVSELGLLSAAEDAGVFSKLESVGAFSFIESTLPLVEKLGLLSLVEALVDVDNGLLFTGANFLIVFTPVVLALTACGFIPTPTGLFIVPEAVVCLGIGAAGFALFALAYAVSFLQEDEDANSGPGGRTQPWFDNLL